MREEDKDAARMRKRRSNWMYMEENETIWHSYLYETNELVVFLWV